MQRTGIPAGFSIRAKPNFFDIIAILLIIALGAYIGSAARHMLHPLSMPSEQAINLNPIYLPGYALRTTLRMFVALIASLLFTFTYAVWAAKSRRAELILIPIMDILQSVPILGFITFTVVFFMSLFPGQVLGAELVTVFVIFTSQVWNMGFSVFQSIHTIPTDMTEVADSFGLTGWQRFCRLEVPASIPNLLWNTMMSMSGGWFMIAYSESVTVGDTTVVLPGIGSYVSVAIDKGNLMAIFYAIIAMLIVILAYDQLLFRPLVAWSSKFRYETTPGEIDTIPWFLRFIHRTRLLHAITDYTGALFYKIGGLKIGRRSFYSKRNTPPSRIVDAIYFTFLCLVGIWTGHYVYNSIKSLIHWNEVQHVAYLGFLTLIRISIMIFISSIIWVPAGIWLGLKPQWAKRTQLIAQFMSAFPSNLFFPFFVLGIVRYHLSANIWLAPLMILGSQWYILFSVTGGAAAFPGDLSEVAKNFNIRGALWWFKVIIPAIFPYYVTGALTACGGAWNTAIAAELAQWGSTTLVADGLGAYISQATNAGDTFRVGLGMAIMSVYVIFFNRLLWHPLYNYARRRFSFS